MDREAVDRFLGDYVQAATSQAQGCDVAEEVEWRRRILDEVIDKLCDAAEHWKAVAVDAYALLARATGDQEATFAEAVAWLSTNSPERLRELSAYWWDTKRYLKASAVRKVLAEREAPDADQP